VLGGSAWLPTGVDVTLAEPDVVLLVLVHLAVSGVVFVLVRRTVERRSAMARHESASSRAA